MFAFSRMRRALVLGVALSAASAALGAETGRSTGTQSKWLAGHEYLELARAAAAKSEGAEERLIDATRLFYKAYLLDELLAPGDYEFLGRVPEHAVRPIWESIREEAKRSSEAGDALAQFALGKALSVPSSGALDFERARDLFEQSHASGHAPAAGRLGLLLLDGEGGPRNEERGRALLEKAAEAGDRHSRGRLAEKTLIGQGVPTDVPRAIRLFEAAAEQGDWLSITWLIVSCATEYYEPYGLDCSPEALNDRFVQAYRWAWREQEMARLATYRRELTKFFPELEALLSESESAGKIPNLGTAP